jgi:hypothetical protein
MPHASLSADGAITIMEQAYFAPSSLFVIGCSLIIIKKQVLSSSLTFLCVPAGMEQGYNPNTR